jgi:hypothetical protein
MHFEKHLNPLGLGNIAWTGFTRNFKAKKGRQGDPDLDLDLRPVLVELDLDQVRRGHRQELDRRRKYSSLQLQKLAHTSITMTSLFNRKLHCDLFYLIMTHKRLLFSH